MILNSCQHLESIQIWCCSDYLNEKELLEVLAKYSPNSFYELKLCYSSVGISKLLPEELESFLTNWSNRISQKSLSLFIIRNASRSLDLIDENMKIIEKYIKLGIIKGFKTIGYYREL